MKPKEITIYDLALKLNISPATVSRGLRDHPDINKTTKKKIFELAKEMGYRQNNFASNLRRQRTNTIGVIVPRLNSNFMSTAIAGIENVANKAGYNLIISQSLESYEKEVANAATMFNNRVDGLLVSLSYNTENCDHFEPFFKKKIPILFFDRVSENHNSANFLIDNRRAAYEATAHLISQGCKKIIHITADSKVNVYKDRVRGYKDALDDNDIAFKEDYVIRNNLSQEAGYAAGEEIREMKTMPDGIFVANDNCAIGCMQALLEAGIKIPEDIAIVGFNNDPVATVIQPNLSTISYPGYQMGEVAASHLINHLSGSSNIDVTNRIILRSELIVRASSQKIAK